MMTDNEIFKGRIIDVNERQTIKDSFHFYRAPGNLYKLYPEIPIESADCLYAAEIINQTKYYPILLYEWFLALKKDGLLCFDIKDNEILNFDGLIAELNQLNLYKKRFEFAQTNEAKGRIVVKKIKSIINSEDQIDCWTFGLVTNGKRIEFVKKTLETIRRLPVKNYEIIICGTYGEKMDADTLYINFKEKDDRGWITKKKNLICEKAKFENLCIIHDRIYFDSEWFDGIQKWGNYFDVLSCPVYLPVENKNVFSNWETVGQNWSREDEYKMFHKNGKLDPADWDKNVYVGGPIILLKKRIWRQCKWNEDLFWGDAEDIEYSQRQHGEGIMIRFNPHAKVYSQTVSGVIKDVYYEKNEKQLGKLRGYKFYEIIFMKFLDLCGIRRNQKIFLQIKKFFNILWGTTDWRFYKK